MDNSAYVIFGFDFRENPEQKELIRLINIEPNLMPIVFCKGDAGTGKTFAALAASLHLVRSKGSKRKYKSVYYVREPVEIGHRLGYLKGTEEDKYGPYLGPLLDNYNHLMANVKQDAASPYREPKRNAKYADENKPLYENLPSDIIPIAPEFIRGRSFSDAILIVDEAQNLTLDELHTLATRLGNNSKMIVIGSPNQIDVGDQTFEHNAFETSYKILEPTGLVGFVELKAPMRSGFVTDFDQRFLQYKLKEGKKR